MAFSYNENVRKSPEESEVTMQYNGGYLIGQIYKLTGRRANELLKKEKVSDINAAQGIIIYSLYDRKCMNIRQIGEATGFAKTSLTSMLERMEQQGLIEKTENSKDRRSTLVKLTPKARRQKKRVDRVLEIVNDELYRGMKESEILRFEKTLEKILHNLETDGED